MTMLSRFPSVSGAASPIYVEDVFKVATYTGTGADQTINTGLNMSGEKGMVIIRDRDNVNDFVLHDNMRPNLDALLTNSSNAAQAFSTTNALKSFNSNGFTVGDGASVGNRYNTSGRTYVSWSFRKSRRFFDVVTFTGNGWPERLISHSLGVNPGMIWMIPYTLNEYWMVRSPGMGMSGSGALNSLLSSATFGAWFKYGLKEYDASSFMVGQDYSQYSSNRSSTPYVAYLFADDTASDGIIRCGTYTGNGSASGPSVSLGWEPQWILIKWIGTTVDGGGWMVFDTTRGLSSGGSEAVLRLESTAAQTTAELVSISSTGFSITSADVNVNRSGHLFTWVAIRKGPMRPA